MDKTQSDHPECLEFPQKSLKQFQSWASRHNVHTVFSFYQRAEVAHLDPPWFWARLARLISAGLKWNRVLVRFACEWRHSVNGGLSVKQQLLCRGLTSDTLKGHQVVLGKKWKLSEVIIQTQIFLFPITEWTSRSQRKMWKVAGSATHKESKTVWKCVPLNSVLFILFVEA